MANVCIQPLMAPKASENCHPAYSILARGNFVESSGTQDDFPIEKTVNGFFHKHYHCGRRVDSG
jgi:hypothetical protein